MEVLKENAEQLSVVLAKLTAENEPQRLIIANMNQTDEELHDRAKKYAALIADGCQQRIAISYVLVLFFT